MIPLEIAAGYTMAGIPHWGEAISSCPDLLSACKLASQPEARIISNNRVSLAVDGGTAVLTDAYTTSRTAETEWEALLSVFLVLDGIRCACGPDWMPRELDLAFGDTSALEQVFDLSDVVVRTNQTATRATFDTIDLSARMPVCRIGASVPPCVPETVQGQIYSLLDTLEPDQKATLNLFADLINASPRTIQRRLTKEGVTFFSIIDAWRMGRALNMLKNSQLQIAEIAAHLHYSNSSHFNRAFSRWTGTTAQKYRNITI